MKTLVILTHPNIQNSVVNKQWKGELLDSQIDVHELYATYPDSKIDVEQEQQRLTEYDTIVFQFPLYWYSSPPLLKQYFDEVFTFGFAYGPEGRALEGKKFAVATTVGSLEADYTKDGSNHFTLEELLTPFKATAHYVGAKYVGHYAQYGTVLHATPVEIAEGTKKYVEFVKGL